MILTILTLLILFGLLSYYIIFSRIKISSFNNDEAVFNKPVSIVICAKNEAKNLKNLAVFWFTQEYDDYEVIIVNDQSTDDTIEVLKKLKQKYSNLEIVNISNEKEKILKGKRNALWQGIVAARYEYLLFTDADTVPNSALWIKEMTKAFSNEKIEIVLGYSPYLNEKTFVNNLIQFDTIMTAFQYFGFAEINLPYMSVGRNVAYKKSILTIESFTNSNKSISGDDDLIFQQVYNNKNFAYQMSSQSFTYSYPEKTLKSWIKQKSRHSSAGNHYHIKMKIILGIFILLNILYTGFLVFNIFHNFSLFLIMISFKVLVFNTLLDFKKFSKNNIIVNNSLQIVIELVYWLFYIIFALKPPIRVPNDSKNKENK